MDIQKQREIIALREEAKSLWQTYQAGKSAALEQQTPILLDAAVSDFIKFLTDQDFEISGGKESILTADSGDGIVITLDRKPLIFSVRMPNGEYYSVMIRTTLEDIKDPYISSSSSQDIEINHYKKSIETLNQHIASIESAEYRYELTMEPRDGNYNRNNRKIYPNFQAVLNEMFS